MYSLRTVCMLVLLLGVSTSAFGDNCITNNGVVYRILGRHHKAVAVGRIKVYGESDVCLLLPRSVSGYDVQGVGECAFSDDLAIRAVQIEEGLWRIGDGAFRGCSGLERLNLPESLMVLGHEAFMGCLKLVELRLPGRLSGDSGARAFKGCDSLSRVVLADDLACDIAPFFYECAGVDKFEVGFNKKYRVVDGCLYDSSGEIFVRCPSKLNISKLCVCAGVKRIADSAFFSCRNLRRVLLPDTVREIGDAAFCASALEEIVIPDGVEFIGMEAFAGCVDLHSVSVPRSMRYVGINCFAGARGLREVVFMGDKPEIDGDDVCIEAEKCHLTVFDHAKGWDSTNTVWGVRIVRKSNSVELAR